MKTKVWTIPNILCVVRMVLIPVFVALFFTVDIYYSLGVFLLASFTDIVDGFIARHFDMVSDVGKFLDPLADKLLKFATVLCFTIRGTLPIYFLIIMLSLDLFLTVSGAIIISEGIIIPSNLVGKLATLTVSIGFILSFLVIKFDVIHPWHLWILGAGLVLIALSIVVYGIKYLRLKKEKNNLAEN